MNFAKFIKYPYFPFIISVFFDSTFPQLLFNFAVQPWKEKDGGHGWMEWVDIHQVNSNFNIQILIITPSIPKWMGCFEFLGQILKTLTMNSH